MTDPSESTPGYARDLLFAAALVVLTLATFWPVLGSELTNWDDSLHLSGNPLFNPPRVSNIPHFWSRSWFGLYIPVSYSLWMIVGVGAWRASSRTLDPTVFHAANLLVHVACVVLVYAIVRKVLAAHSTRRGSRVAQCGGIAFAAAIGAAIFAVHPLQVETVAWASAWRDLLCWFFALLAIWRHVLEPRRWVVALALFAAAILCKPAAVVVPVVVILIDRLLQRPWRASLAAATPMFLLAVACVIWSRVVQPSQYLEPSPLWSRPLVAADAVAFYLWKLVWPTGLCIDYGRTPQMVLQTAQVYWTWLIPVGVALALGRSRIALIGAGVFVAGAAPVLGFVPFDFQNISTVADRYVYFSLLGVAIIAAAAMVNCRRLFGAIAIVLVLLLAVRSWHQTWHWRDSRSLYDHALQINPRGWITRTNLAMLALDGKDYNAAERLCRQALDLKRDNPDALVNLSTALAMQHRTAEAIPLLQEAIRLRSDMADAHANLAAAYGELGQLDDALRECQTALRINSRHPQAMRMLPMLRAAVARAPATTQASH